MASWFSKHRKYFFPLPKDVKQAAVQSVQHVEKVAHQTAAVGKQVGRFNARIETRVAPVAVPIASFIVGLFTFGLGGEAVAALGYATTDYQAKVAGRGKGLHGSENNAQARSKAKRVGIYAAITGAIGGLIGAIFGAPGAAFGGAAAPVGAGGGATGVALAGTGADVLATTGATAAAGTGIFGTGITWTGLLGGLTALGGIIQRVFPGLLGGSANASPNQLSDASGTGGALGGGAGGGGNAGTGDFAGAVDDAAKALAALPTGVKVAAAVVGGLGLTWLVTRKG
jgi:hypothetical protein